MAATNSHVPVYDNSWVELTDSDVTNITVQNLDEHQYVSLIATTGAAPVSASGAINLPAGEMFVNEALADLWPGATGAVRVFARAQAQNALVMVSHA